MKTPEELNALKAEVETLNKKRAALSDEELTQVSGGGPTTIDRFFTWMECTNCGYKCCMDGDQKGEKYYCIYCGKITLTGMEIFRD